MIYEIAENHITTDYDDQFATACNNGEMRWYPWVGRDYRASGILIVGKSTYYESDDDWSDGWRKCCDETRMPNRELVADNIAGDGHKPFEAMAKMFVENAAGGDYESGRETFWASVAFLNFCQKIVCGENGECEDVATSKVALRKAIAIIKPKLVLAWTTELWNFHDGECRDGERFGQPQPRAIDGTPPIVGVLHPSYWQAQRTSRDSWVAFLRGDPASKQPVKDFIAYLKRRLD